MRDGGDQLHYRKSGISERTLQCKTDDGYLQSVVQYAAGDENSICGRHSDGGVADSIPIIHSLKTGHQRNVIILTRNKGYRKHSSGKQDRLFELAYGKKYPKLVEVLEQRAKVYNKTLYYIDKWEKEGKVFVLRPEIEPVARLERDTQKLENFYQHGYDLMEEKFEEMKWFLNR